MVNRRRSIVDLRAEQEKAAADYKKKSNALSARIASADVSVALKHYPHLAINVKDFLVESCEVDFEEVMKKEDASQSIEVKLAAPVGSSSCGGSARDDGSTFGDDDDEDQNLKMMCCQAVTRT